MEPVEKIAACILNEMGSLTTMKLQKLVYYSQAHHLVFFDSPLFAEAIEAWANGPVVRSLYELHRGEFVVKAGFLGEDRIEGLPSDAQRSVRAAISALGSMTGAQLSDLTHAEAPWLEARRGLGPYDRSSEVIGTDRMRAYYSAPACDNPLFAA